VPHGLKRYPAADCVARCSDCPELHGAAPATPPRGPSVVHRGHASTEASCDHALQRPGARRPSGGGVGRGAWEGAGCPWQHSDLFPPPPPIPFLAASPLTAHLFPLPPRPPNPGGCSLASPLGPRPRFPDLQKENRWSGNGIIEHSYDSATRMLTVQTVQLSALAVVQVCGGCSLRRAGTCCDMLRREHLPHSPPPLPRSPLPWRPPHLWRLRPADSHGDCMFLVD
jgi:hypothetical protein